jgi:hypothetical protein
MAKIVTPLTNTEVKQAKLKDKVYKLSDGEGLQLRIKPNGTKTWLLDYFKPYTKKRTSISLGSYPSVTLAEACQKKREARELLAKDIDPKAHRDEATELAKEELQNTFDKVAIINSQQCVECDSSFSLNYNCSIFESNSFFQKKQFKQAYSTLSSFIKKHEFKLKQSLLASIEDRIELLKYFEQNIAPFPSKIERLYLNKSFKPIAEKEKKIESEFTVDTSAAYSAHTGSLASKNMTKVDTLTFSGRKSVQKIGVFNLFGIK